MLGMGWWAALLQDKKGHSHEQATEQLEERARLDEREEAGEQQCPRRLHQRPPERLRLKRGMQEGERLGKRRRLLLANGDATREQQGGVE